MIQLIMKTSKIIFSVVLLLVSTLSFSQENSGDAIITKTFPNGQLRSISVINDTVKNGIQVELDNYGRLLKQGSYLFGKLNGTQITFERGRVSLVKNYSNGLLDGKVERYNASRRLSSTENYIDGKKSGESKWYYYSGKLCTVYSYVDGSVEGETKYFHENGKLKSTYVFIKNKIEGAYLEYDEKGNKIVEGQYSRGKKEGKWKFYSDKGTLLRVDKFKKGIKN